MQWFYYMPRVSDMSALQLLMFSYELQRRIRLQGAPMDVFAVHPGGCALLPWLASC